jgi:hypothetical protein
MKEHHLVLGIVTNRPRLRPWWSTLVQNLTPMRSTRTTLVWVDASPDLEDRAEALALVGLLRSEDLAVELVFPSDPSEPVGLLRNRVLGAAKALRANALMFIDDDDWFSPDLLCSVEPDLRRFTERPPGNALPVPWVYFKTGIAFVQADLSAWAPFMASPLCPALPSTLFNLRHGFFSDPHDWRFGDERSESDVAWFRRWRDRGPGWGIPRAIEGLRVPTIYAAIRHDWNTGNTTPLGMNRLKRPRDAEQLVDLFTTPSPAWSLLVRGLETSQ